MCCYRQIPTNGSGSRKGYPQGEKGNEDGVALSTRKDFTRGDMQEAFSSCIFGPLSVCPSPMLRPVSGEGEYADADFLSAIMGFCGYIGEKMLPGILTTRGYSSASLQHDYAMIMRRTPNNPLRH